MSYRIAQPDDAPVLAKLINAAFRSEVTGQTWLYDDQAKRIDIAPENLILGFITSEDMIMFVGTLEGEPLPVTTCFLRRPSTTGEPHRTPGAAWLGFLAVSPNQHKRGLGAAMLFQAEAYARDVWKTGLMELDAVNSRQELRSWYNRCGYVETGITRPFPYGEHGREILADGLEMVVKLKKLNRDAVGYRECLIEG